MYADAFAAWMNWPVEWAPMIGDWEMVPLQINGQTAGLAALDGTEVHFALDPEWRGRAITRKRAREFIAPLIARRGYLTTRALNPDKKQREFLLRFGFRKTWTDAQTEHFMLTCLPFDKRN